MFGGLGRVVDLGYVRIALARSDRVQQRLPEVGGPAVHQHDARVACLAHAVSQPRCQLKSTGSASNNDDRLHMIPSKDC